MAPPPDGIRYRREQEEMAEEVTVSRLPDCQICKSRSDVPVPAAYDGKTVFGPWAYMCEADFAKYGVGLGTGEGQRLILKEDWTDTGSGPGTTDPTPRAARQVPGRHARIDAVIDAVQEIRKKNQQ
jgi:hypothetical protein